MGQWLLGLQPSLCLTTKSDGSIIVTSEVTTLSAVKTHFRSQPSVSRYPHRSGKNSRSRRKIQRSFKMNDVESNVSQPFPEEQLPAVQLPLYRETQP